MSIIKVMDEKTTHPLTLAEIDELTEELHKKGITYETLLSRYEAVAYPNGDAKHSKQQEYALALYRHVNAAKPDIRKAFLLLSEKGHSYEEAKSLLG